MLSLCDINTYFETYFIFLKRKIELKLSAQQLPETLSFSVSLSRHSEICVYQGNMSRLNVFHEPNHYNSSAVLLITIYSFVTCGIDL